MAVTLHHDHDPDETPGGGTSRRLIIAAVANLLMAGAAVAGAHFSGSLALWSDAGHLLLDVSGVALVLLAIRLGLQGPDDRHTYGHRRFEVFAATVNALLLIGVAASIVWAAAHRFAQPPEIHTGIMLMVAAITCAGNLGIGLWLMRAKGGLGLKSVITDLFSDALASVGVLVAALLIRITGITAFDAGISLGIGLLIIAGAARVLRDASHVFMDGTPPGFDLAEIRRTLETAPGVAGVHDLHVWSLGPGLPALSAHVTAEQCDDTRALLIALRDLLATRFDIHHQTLQSEPRAGCGELPH